MKKITFEIDDKYATILSVTAIGCHIGVDVATWAVDITKYDHITLDKNAHWENAKDGADNDAR